jgi:enoyl-[acyl-carrier protein] reductase II
MIHPLIIERNLEEEAMFRTEICDILGIELPIIQGGMVWVSYHGLCAAVSEAGGLGTLAGGSMVPDGLRHEIRLVKEKTEKPFAVNIPLVQARSEDLVNIALEEKVKVIVTSAGNPKRFTPRIQEAGLKVVHVTPSVKLAMKAAEAGVDAVVAEGIEAGGHDGFDEISTMALVPQMVDTLQIPVIAAGGIADSRGFLAAMALGAKGVQMGTRFAATHEAVCHWKFKEAIVRADDAGTVITGRSIGPVRCIRNALAQKILEMERNGAVPEDLLTLIGKDRSKRAAMEGEVEEGTIYCGEIAGLIHELKSAEEVIRDVVEGAELWLRELNERARK